MKHGGFHGAGLARLVPALPAMHGPLAELTLAAAQATIRLVERLSRSFAYHRIGVQLFKSVTSQAANYGAALRARSTREFISRLKVVEEESDEAAFWVERLFDASLPSALHQDARALESQLTQVTRMTVASIKTSRARLAETARRRNS